MSDRCCDKCGDMYVQICPTCEHFSHKESDLEAENKRLREALEKLRYWFGTITCGIHATPVKIIDDALNQGGTE